MRFGIETAPRDGRVVFLEDETKVAYEVARWSSEGGVWVLKSGEPIAIVPTHWCSADSAGAPPTRNTVRFALPRQALIAVILIASAAMGAYFHSYIGAQFTRQTDPGTNPHLDIRDNQIKDANWFGNLQDIFRAARQSEPIRTPSTGVAATPSEHPMVVLDQATARGAELEQSLPPERSRTATLDTVVFDTQREVAAVSSKKDEEAAQSNRRTEAGSAELQNSLEQERSQVAALTNELADVRRELAAVSSRKDDEATQLQRSAEMARTELQNSLEKERDRTVALKTELANVRRDLAAESSKKDEEAEQLKRSAEMASTALRRSLEQEREQTAALEIKLADARSEFETASRARDEQLDQLKFGAAANAELQQLLAQEHDLTVALEAQLAETRGALAATSRIKEAAQLKPAVDARIEELQHSLEDERGGTAALKTELTDVRRELSVVLRGKEEQADDLKAAETASSELRQILEQERARTAALDAQLTGLRREHAAASSKKDEETAQLREAAGTANAQLKQLLEQERRRTFGLDTALADTHRELALASRTTVEQADQLKSAERTAAELRQSFEQQRGQTAALETDLGAARRELAVVSRRNEAEPVVHDPRPGQPAAAELMQPTEQERGGAVILGNEVLEAGPQLDTPAITAHGPSQSAREADDQRAGERFYGINTPPAKDDKSTLLALGKAEATTMIVRASKLLAQGNIAGARVVLERIVEAGSAEASFALAETYDPNVLPLWGTIGTQANSVKALDLYSRAATGGIVEAKQRAQALGQ